MPESHQSATGPAGAVADRLESLSCMAFGISHEFNNMLAAVLINAEAALGKLPADSTIRPYLARINSNTRAAIALTKQIQMFTEDGAASFETIDLASLVTEIATQVRAEVPATCSIYTDALDPTSAVNAIPQLLRASTAALLWNAVESLPEQGGEVHIRAYRARPAATAEGGISLGKLPTEPCTLLEIADNGRGIPPDALHRIFDPFFSTRLRGRGLGLIPVVGLIQSCQTALQVESAPGRGTTVRILFNP